MSYQSLGPMPHAPLVYTVGMLEYAPIPEISDYIPSIQEALRREFPEILPRISINRLHVSFNTAQRRQEFRQIEDFLWAMNTADREWGVVFGENRLILQTGSYAHFEDFVDRFCRIVQAISKKAEITYTSSIGIRYIDNILDRDGLSIGEQLIPGFMSPALTPEFVPELSRVEHIYKSNEGNLFLRCYTLQDHPGIPEDVRVMADQLFRGQAAMTNVEERFALLDTDHIYRPDQLEPFNIDDIAARLNRLHEGASMAFRTAVTQEALTAWRGEHDTK